MRNIVPDIREALRQWRRTPAITVAALLSLTLGIGASTAIFSLLNALLLKQLPIRDPQQIVTFRHSGSPNPLNLRISYRMFEVLSRDGAGMDGIAVYAAQPLNLAPKGEPVRNARGLFVSGSYFDLLGVPVARGRMLTTADDDLNAPSRVAVVSEGFWRSTLGSDPNVVGRSIDVIHQPFTIVGVIDRRFMGIEVGQAFDVALPLASYGLVSDPNRFKIGHLFWLTTIGRLPRDESMAAMEARLAPVQARVIRETPMPETVAAAVLKSSWLLQPTSTAMVLTRVNYQRPLLILLGITIIVLAVACVNIANLLIARMASRRSELAVRLSLGATRGRLVWQLALEAMVLAAAGTLSGVVAGVVGSRALVWLLSTSRNAIQLDLGIDWRVAIFAASAGTLTALLAGMLPAWRSMGLDPIEAIKARAAGAIGGTRGVGGSHLLIGGQIALTFMLVLGGLVFSSSFARLITEDRGFDRGRVQLVGVRGPTGMTTPLTTLPTSLQERLRAVPGVEDAAFSLAAPFGSVTFITYVSATGPQMDRKSWPQETHVVQNIVSANYFDVMGIRMLAGQAFKGNAVRADAVVVNTAFAKQFLGGQSPVGRTLWFGLDQRPVEIIGVVNDTKGRLLRDDAPPMLYLAWQRETQENAFVQLTVRSAGFTPSAAAMAQAIEQLVPGASVEVRSLDVEVADTVATERATATLAFFFGVCGLLLAAIGLYGVLSREVHVRRPEIAVRMALGAAPQRVRRLVLFRVLAATAAGLIAGIGLSIAAEQLVRSLLYEVQPSDAGQLATCVAIVVLVSIAAVAAPVRRATRVDPMTVLRSE